MGSPGYSQQNPSHRRERQLKGDIKHGLWLKQENDKGSQQKDIREPGGSPEKEDGEKCRRHDESADRRDSPACQNKVKQKKHERENRGDSLGIHIEKYPGEEHQQPTNKDKKKDGNDSKMKSRDGDKVRGSASHKDLSHRGGNMSPVSDEEGGGQSVVGSGDRGGNPSVQMLPHPADHARPVPPTTPPQHNNLGKIVNLRDGIDPTQGKETAIIKSIGIGGRPGIGNGAYESNHVPHVDGLCVRPVNRDTQLPVDGEPSLVMGQKGTNTHQNLGPCQTGVQWRQDTAFDDPGILPREVRYVIFRKNGMYPGINREKGYQETTGNSKKRLPRQADPLKKKARKYQG